jgi:hypothetical protein
MTLSQHSRVGVIGNLNRCERPEVSGQLTREKFMNRRLFIGLTMIALLGLASLMLMFGQAVS